MVLRDGSFHSCFILHVQEGENDAEGFEKFMPKVMFLLRDVILSLSEGNKTPRDELESVLKISASRSKAALKQNEIKQDIKRYCACRDVFFLDSPHTDMTKLVDPGMEKIKFEDLKASFRQQSSSFVEKVLEDAGPKLVHSTNMASNGNDAAYMTGKAMAVTAAEIVKSLNEGKAASVQGMWEATSRVCTKETHHLHIFFTFFVCLVKAACDEAKQLALEIYINTLGFQDDKTLPVTIDKLTERSKDATTQATQVFSSGLPKNFLISWTCFACLLEIHLTCNGTGGRGH